MVYNLSVFFCSLKNWHQYLVYVWLVVDFEYGLLFIWTRPWWTIYGSVLIFLSHKCLFSLSYTELYTHIPCKLPSIDVLFLLLCYRNSLLCFECDRFRSKFKFESNCNCSTLYGVFDVITECVQPTLNGFLVYSSDNLDSSHDKNFSYQSKELEQKNENRLLLCYRLLDTHAHTLSEHDKFAPLETE